MKAGFGDKQPVVGFVAKEMCRPARPIVAGKE